MPPSSNSLSEYQVHLGTFVHGYSSRHSQTISDRVQIGLTKEATCPVFQIHLQSLSSSRFHQDVPQVISRTHRHPLLPQQTIRRGQMEMEVRERKLADIALAREAEVTHFTLHNQLLVLLALERLGAKGLEQLDGLGDAALQLGEGLLVVGEEDVSYAADARGG